MGQTASSLIPDKLSALSSESWWSTALAATAAVTITSYAVHELIYKSRKSGGKAPPGPLFVIPFVGETPEFAMDVPGFMWRRYKKYQSDVFQVHLLGKPTYVIADPELCRGALSDPTVVTAELPVETFSTLLGNLYNRVGARHKIFRKHQQQALLPQNLKTALPGIKRIISSHVGSWLQACSKGPDACVTVDQEIRRMFIELAMGPLVSFNVEGVIGVDELTDLASTVHAGLFAPPIYLPGTTWWKAYNNRDYYFSVLAQLLEKRFPPATPGGPVRLEADIGAEPGVDLMSALVREVMEAGESLKAKDMAQRLAQSIIAATETTAYVVLAALVATAARPDVQAKMRQEQAALVQRSGLDIQWADLGNNMPYLDAVVKETFRLLPSAHAAYRKLIQTVEVGGYTLEKGNFVMLSLDLASALDSIKYATAKGELAPADAQGTRTALPLDYDPNRWHVAFKPERWLEQGENAHSRNLWLFGYGGHMCLGRDIAQLEVKLVLAYMARQCTWSMPNLKGKPPQFGFLPFTYVANGKPDLRLVPAPLA